MDFDTPLKIRFKKADNWYESSSYSPAKNEIVVLEGIGSTGSLYHEYRHYIQFRDLPNWILIWAGIGRFLVNWILFLIFICMIFSLYKCLITVAVIDLVLVFPALLMEMDANIFAIKRIWKKKVFLPNIWSLLLSIGCYGFCFFYFQCSLIETILKCYIHK